MRLQKQIFTVLAAMLLFARCQHAPQEDSKEIAEVKNESKFKSNETKEKDAQLVVDIIAYALAEIRMAELGEQKATSLEVKEIATMLKAEHTDIVNTFRSYATLKDISLPSEVTPDDKKEENEVIDKRNFDAEWYSDIKNLHKKSMLKLEDASTKAHDPELKELARETLPTIKLHYDKILSIKVN